MYHYVECGLSNVWLVNGFKRQDTVYGEGVSFENLKSLHSSIGKFLCSSSPRLKGAELRFLRSEMELSQSALARLLGNDAQSIALWEKSRVVVPKWANRLLRALYREHMGENIKVKKLIEEALNLEKGEEVPLHFEVQEEAKGWQLKAA